MDRLVTEAHSSQLLVRAPDCPSSLEDGATAYQFCWAFLKYAVAAMQPEKPFGGRGRFHSAYALGMRGLRRATSWVTPKELTIMLHLWYIGDYIQSPLQCSGYEQPRERFARFDHCFHFSCVIFFCFFLILYFPIFLRSGQRQLVDKSNPHHLYHHTTTTTIRRYRQFWCRTTLGTSKIFPSQTSTSHRPCRPHSAVLQLVHPLLTFGSGLVAALTL